jgi:hypothetical protein
VKLLVLRINLIIWKAWMLTYQLVIRQAGFSLIDEIRGLSWTARFAEMLAESVCFLTNIVEEIESAVRAANVMFQKHVNQEG